MTSTNTIDFEAEWRGLQEANRCFIVLDGNDFIVFCNQALNAAYCPSLQRYFLPHDCFWLETEQRTLHFSEFKALVGQEVDLLFRQDHGEFLKLKVTVEEIELEQKKYLRIETVTEDSLSQSSTNAGEKLLVGELIAGLKQGCFSIYYQPQFDTANKRLYGVEALARWNRVNKETISPDIFIALAEKYHFIAELDLWVFENVCQQMGLWEANNVKIPMVSVNFSPMSFDHPHLYERVLSIMESNKISPTSLTIEITESRKIKCCDITIDTILHLHKLGLNISLDDFGMGYSNFNRLTKIPVSQIKLDRSFVFNLPEGIYSEISQSILSIGKSLELSIIAEGVETQDQLNILENMGYTLFQGYLFSKPLMANELEKWVQNHSS